MPWRLIIGGIVRFPGKKILIVDDDDALLQMLELAFEVEGAEVVVADNGRKGLQLFHKHQPDIVLLDVLMPEMNGWETCKQIRLEANSPVIMMTTLADDQNIVRGLENGADDYMVKPFSVEVLQARVSAVLRRAALDLADEDLTSYVDEHLKINLHERSVYVAQERLKLSATEFKLLSFFLKHANQILSYQQILLNIWGVEYRENIDYVHVYVSHLRRKLEPDPRNPIYFVTEYGIGYRFINQPAAK